MANTPIRMRRSQGHRRNFFGQEEIKPETEVVSVLIETLTKDLAYLVLDFIPHYSTGDIVWSYFHDGIVGCTPELRKARIIGYDRNHDLYLLFWLDSCANEDNVERTSDYIFPCGEGIGKLKIGDTVWTEHEFGPFRMFEARVISANGKGSFTIEPLDKSICFGTAPIIRSRNNLKTIEPPTQLYAGDICWAERSCPMGTYSQIYRAEVLSFSANQQKYTVKWLDSFGHEFPESSISRFQLMPYISQQRANTYLQVGDRAMRVTSDGQTAHGTILDSRWLVQITI